MALLLLLLPLLKLLKRKYFGTETRAP
jgi:hypothetical protein